MAQWAVSLPKVTYGSTGQRNIAMGTGRPRPENENITARSTGAGHLQAIAMKPRLFPAWTVTSST